MLDDLEESLEPLHGEPWAATTPHQPAIRPDQTRPDTQQTLRYHPQISTSLPTALFPKPPLPEYSYLVGALLFAAIESAPPCPPLESNTDIVSIALQHFSSQRALPPLQVVAAHHHQRPLLSRPGRRACRLHTVASHCAECAWCTPRSQTSQTSQTPRRRYLQDPLKDDKTPRRLPLVRAQAGLFSPLSTSGFSRHFFPPVVCLLLPVAIASTAVGKTRNSTTPAHSLAAASESSLYPSTSTALHLCSGVTRADAVLQGTNLPG